MNNHNRYIFTLYSSTNMHNMLENAVNLSNNLFSGQLADLNLLDYRYTPDDAIAELGLDLDLVNHLVEDYVVQIVKSNMTFLGYIKDLESTRNMNYTPLRELAHKNLGVARNLRIYDAQILLEKIMKEDDLDIIFLYLEGLFACATILRPQHAFNTLKLIKIKYSF